ncbi:MAG: geranylgeranylglycerol-phosphate geranylgeranyltransferase [Bacteroidales bacterium]|nr:geranylgeranylglycerol-phosphate geranylgeranyltransferase [Bacteroidales bacterium]
MTTFLKLIRWPNLIIIVLSMSFMLVFIIKPGLDIKVFSDGLTFAEFALLVVSTLLIAIGGYIINDVSDINTDSINKPGKNIIGKMVSVEFAYRLYWITTCTGIITGALLSYLINQINFSLIFVFSAGLLWFYSQKYKCQPLVGNIVISFLSSLSFALVWLFEFYALSNNAAVFVNVQSDFPLINRLLIIYMGFAFMVSLLREVIKDIEDYKGDNRFGCLTFTVKYGISASKLIALIVAYISLFSSGLIQYYFFNANFNLLFSAFFLIDLLLIVIIGLLHKASSKPNYTRLSLMIKILMLVGILSMILFYFEI